MIKYYSQGLCVECNEGIFVPICPSCLSRQLNVWIGESGIDENIKRKIKKVIAEKQEKNLPFIGVKCAVCRINDTEICPYCFTEHVYQMFKKLRLNKKLLEGFFTCFNYDFEHTGYSRDFE